MTTPNHLHVRAKQRSHIEIKCHYLFDVSTSVQNGLRSLALL